MEPADLTRATAASLSIVTALGLPATDAVVLRDSNMATLRLLPSDVVARVAHAGGGGDGGRSGRDVAAFEVELAEQLRSAGAPVAGLDRRTPAQVHEADGFAVTLWTHCDGPPPTSAAYAAALADLHGGLRRVDLATQHFTDRVAEAERIAVEPARSPALADDDRELLVTTLRRLRDAVLAGGALEQPLHGEPHPGNVLGSPDGPRFIDLETCCRGPVEFDVAHLPDAVAKHYPGLDADLLSDCRGLVVAMVAAWRWDRDDQLPDGLRLGQELLRLLRAGPPWPTLDHLG